jgi:hypothetical protein
MRTLMMQMRTRIRCLVHQSETHREVAVRTIVVEQQMQSQIAIAASDRAAAGPLLVAAGTATGSCMPKLSLEASKGELVAAFAGE